MKIKMTLTKTEKILAILNQWDPEDRRGSDGKLDWRAYHFEADTIAQQVRSNSSVKTVEKSIRETLDVEQINDEEIKTVAKVIAAGLKK